MPERSIPSAVLAASLIIAKLISKHSISDQYHFSR